MADSQGGRKKGRQYATQAYDVGAGGNAVQGGMPPPGAGYPGVADGQQGYQSTPQPQQQQPQYAQQPAFGGAPSYGAPAYGQPQPAYGGAQHYGQPAPQQQQSPAPGLNEKFGAMNMGDQAAPQARYGGPTALNRLQTADLGSQPFHVSEVDSLPPPIVLPPNVRLEDFRFYP